MYYNQTPPQTPNHKTLWEALLFALIVTAAIIIGTSLTGCRAPYTPITTVVVRDSVVYVPQASVSDTITICELDTFHHDKLTVHTVTDTSGRARLSWVLDENRRLILKCIAEPETITVPAKTITTRGADVVKYVNRTPAGIWVLVGALILVLLAAMVLVFVMAFK